MGQDPDAIRQDIAQTRTEMSDTVEAIGYKADVPARAREKVSEKVDAARAKVSQATSRAKEAVAGSSAGASDRAGGVAARVGDAAPSGEQVRRQARRAVGLAQENPLGLAIGAAAVGFLAGLVVPSTRVEDERLGPAADQVKDTVRETGQEALARGKQVAQQAASSATETAKQQSQDLAQSTKQRAQEVREQVRDQAP